MRDRPYFLWDVQITESQLREPLHHADADVGHRTTEDLDLFSAAPGLELADAARTMSDVAEELGGRTEAVQTHPEIKDLVDLEMLLGAGQSLERALEDASKKDAGVEPETLAWVLEQVSIGSEAALPGGVEPATVDAFRQDVVKRRHSRP